MRFAPGAGCVTIGAQVVSAASTGAQMAVPAPWGIRLAWGVAVTPVAGFLGFMIVVFLVAAIMAPMGPAVPPHPPPPPTPLRSAGVRNVWDDGIDQRIAGGDPVFLSHQTMAIAAVDESERAAAAGAALAGLRRLHDARLRPSGAMPRADVTTR